MGDVDRIIRPAASPPAARVSAAVGRNGASQEELRSTFSRYPTGVTVLGAGNDELMRGMTAASFTSVSLVPPLVLVCIRRGTLMRQVVLDAQAFAVSVLAVTQEPVARHFADPGRPPGRAQFAAVGWWPAPVTGAPMLAGSIAWLDCRLEDVTVAGDHEVIFGRVAWATRTDRRDPLLYFARSYQRLQSSAAASPALQNLAGRQPSRTRGGTDVHPL